MDKVLQGFFRIYLQNKIICNYELCLMYRTIHEEDEAYWPESQEKAYHINLFYNLFKVS